MRDSNYKLISNNRAAVTITTTLYDRRALDVTSDKPLVNSLNHLTYLVSSSQKVRETLSSDGGIERLIEILHECHNSTCNLNDSDLNSEKKVLTAWKWTLAFQCLVLVGTRGTEAIRQRVVNAGILPIIATVLDNYITLYEREFSQADRRFNEAVFASNSFSGSSGGVASQSTDTEQNQSQPPSQSPQPTAGTQDTQQDDIRNSLSFLTQFETFQNNFPISASNTAAAALAATSVSNGMSGISPFFNSSSLTNEDYENLSVEQLLTLVRLGDNNDVNDEQQDIRRRYLILMILKKLKEEKDSDLPDTRLSDSDYDMDNNLQFLFELYLQGDKSSHFSNLSNAKVAPRNFTDTGVVIPRVDDITWSLQLLAYISKYSYLKEALQNTHLVIDMSVRDKQLKLFIEKQLKSKLKKDLAIKQRPTIKPKSRKSKLMGINDKGSDGKTESENSGNLGFNPSASNSPQMLNGINSLQDDNFMLDQDKLELCDEQDNNVEDGLRVNDANVEVSGSIKEAESDPESGSVSDSGSDFDNLVNPTFPAYNLNKFGEIYDSIMDCESIIDPLDRDLALFNLKEKINKSIERESKDLSITITKKRIEQKEYLKQKWNYDTYDNFNIDNQAEKNCPNDEIRDPDFDESLIEYKKVNLFPMVEKFTFLAGTDMYYWSGVIMRNSCRRNEDRGGVRQCGNLECGTWETYPREFLKCRRCKRTKYCSRECQTRAWNCHRNWCIPSNNNSGNHNNETEQEQQAAQTADVTTTDSDTNGVFGGE